MTTPTVILIGGAAIALFGGGYLVGHHTVASPIPVQVAQGAVQVRQAAQEKADTVYQRMDHILTKTLQHFDTISVHDTILRHLTDTVLVAQYVAACDSLRGACQAFRDSSQRLRDADHALIQAQTVEIHAWQSSQPSKLRRIITYAAVAGAGFGLCKAGLSIPFLH
jgi:hypothetical protein